MCAVAKPLETSMRAVFFAGFAGYVSMNINTHVYILIQGGEDS